MIKYNREESYIAGILDDVPKLQSPELMRELLVDGDEGESEGGCTFTLAKRVSNRLVLEWRDGEEEDENYSANLSPYNPDNDSDKDYWKWGGEVTVKYYSFGAGLHGDNQVKVTERGSVDGWIFDYVGSTTFVGELFWDLSLIHI